MFNLEFDPRWIEVDAKLREIGHLNGSYDAVRAVNEKISSITGETKKDNDAIAEAC